MMLPCVEDGEVGNLHCDALEHQLSDARYHVGNHTLNRSSRKWGVVTCHVIYELVDVVGLSDDRIGEEPGRNENLYRAAP